MDLFQKKINETGDSRYLYQKELDKACFQHDMSYGVFKDLTRRAASDKILRDKAFNISKNPKNENISSKKLAKELQKPIIGKFKKRKVHSFFIDNIELLIFLICN